MSECEPLSLPTWVLGVTPKGGAVTIPESIVSIFDNCFHFRHFYTVTEFTDFRAAGL